MEDNLSHKGWKALMAWQSLVIGTDAVLDFLYLFYICFEEFLNRALSVTVTPSILVASYGDQGKTSPPTSHLLLLQSSHP